MRILSSLFFLTAFACGGSSADPVTATGGGGASSSANGATNGSDTSSGSGANNASYTLQMDPFVVQPGEEVFKCQNFSNPFGEDVDVVRFESHMTPGSHHLILFQGDGYDDGPLDDCSGLEFAPTLYGSQTPDAEVKFPDGVGALITSTTGFRINSHYLNTSGQPITANVTITLDLAAPGTVDNHAGVLWAINQNIYVAPNSHQVISHSCSIPLDMNIIQASSHMHSHGTHFVATIDEALLYETDSWSEPEPAFFDPGLAVDGGATLTFSCEYQNDTPQPLTFGESAANNEMCVMTAAFYPVPDASSTTFTCN